MRRSKQQGDLRTENQLASVRAEIQKQIDAVANDLLDMEDEVVRDTLVTRDGEPQYYELPPDPVAPWPPASWKAMRRCGPASMSGLAPWCIPPYNKDILKLG